MTECYCLKKKKKTEWLNSKWLSQINIKEKMSPAACVFKSQILFDVCGQIAFGL